MVLICDNNVNKMSNDVSNRLIEIRSRAIKGCLERLFLFKEQCPLPFELIRVIFMILKRVHIKENTSVTIEMLDLIDCCQEYIEDFPMPHSIIRIDVMCDLVFSTNDSMTDIILERVCEILIRLKYIDRSLFDDNINIMVEVNDIGPGYDGLRILHHTNINFNTALQEARNWIELCEHLLTILHKTTP
jgi:hypothetical protein